MKQLSTSCRLLVLLFFTLALRPAHASHICGAELYYTYQSGDTYELELQVYSDLNMLPDTQWLDAADGSIVPLVHTSAQMLESFCCGYRHTYLGTHDYPVDGVYLLHVEIFSRQATVINIMDPAYTPVCVTTQLAINSVIGPNTSVRFNAPQTAAYFVGSDFVHDPQPYDADGDSLSFELISPAGSNCILIYPYDYPHEVSPAPTDTSWIDPVTGVFTWIQPTYVGKYVIAIRCWEWRNGIPFSSVVRDMNLCIYATTGVDEPVSAVPFTVTSGDARNITATIPGASAGPLAIFDVNGRRVLEIPVGVGRNSIDLHALAPGTYVGRLQPNGRAPMTTRFALW
jgi:hypothetical protein